MTKKRKIKKEEFEVELVDKYDNEDLFDDCPICRAMKLAKEEGRKPTLAELKEVFKKAKEQGAIVGGEWFEEGQK